MVGFNWLLSQREGMRDTCLNCYIICSQTYTHTHIDNEPICCCWLYYLTWIQWSTNFYFLFIFTHSQYCIYSKNLLFSFFVPVIFKFFFLFFGSVNNWIITFDVLMMTCDVLSLILIRFFWLNAWMSMTGMLFHWEWMERKKIVMMTTHNVIWSNLKVGRIKNIVTFSTLVNRIIIYMIK